MQGKGCKTREWVEKLSRIAWLQTGSNGSKKRCFENQFWEFPLMRNRPSSFKGHLVEEEMIENH